MVFLRHRLWNLGVTYVYTRFIYLVGKRTIDSCDIIENFQRDLTPEKLSHSISNLVLCQEGGSF